MSIETVPVIVVLASDLYLAKHSKPIREQFPATKLWEYEWIDDVPYRIRLNGIGEENDGIEPFGLHVYGNGWPIFMGNPAGGVVAMTTEDELVDVLRKEVQRAVTEPATENV